MNEPTLVDEFLRMLGHTRGSIARLPDVERTSVLRAASSYANRNREADATAVPRGASGSLRGE